jgi:Zn-dependent protease with chaperone function
MKFAKITSIMLWVFLGISVFLVISLLSNLNENTSDPGMDTWVNANLYWSYILFFISIGSALILETIYIASDKKAAKSAMTAVLFLGAVIGLSYLLSDSSIPKFYGVEKFIEDGSLTTNVSKWIGTGLIATYILSALSIIGIVWSSISRIFK